MLGKAPDVVPQGLAGLLLAIFEVLRVAWSNVRALEVSYENSPEVRPASDGIGGQELQPGTDVLSQADREVLDDELVVVRSPGSACEPVIF